MTDTPSPCGIKWCVALAETKHPYCKVHRRDPGYQPQKYLSFFDGRTPKEKESAE